MAFAQETALPPLDISSIRSSITIFSTSSEYIAYVATEMGAFPLTIPLKPHDVKNLNSLLQTAIQKVASSIGKDSTYEETLAELIYWGKYAFQRLFPTPYAQDIIHDAVSRGSIVQIVSKDFFIPWEMIYDAPKGVQDDVENFWGMSRIISRLIIQEHRSGSHTSPILPSLRPRVGLITSDRLPFVQQQEVPALMKLHKNKNIQVKSLQELSTTQRMTALAKLQQFLGQELDILHFACHAYEQDPIEKSYLFVTKDFAVSMSDFVVSQYELTHHPFVILNACLSGVVNPLYTSSWAEKLWEHGARGVLATDFQVPDWFGASFSEVLYKYLLSGLWIGGTLVNARRYFWKEHHNPLGLAYALYSSPSIQIATDTKK
ncbi:MAG: hypothetical protein PVSMB2_13180 [Ktedonobacteraceae bacterium]